jgi:hypothetical protein
MNNTIKKIGMIFISIAMLSSNLCAKDKLSANELLNLAGKQRMLSQRIAKDYLYIGKNIAKSKANRELKESMKSFLLAHKRLVSSIDNSEIKNLLEFVALSSGEFKDTSEKAFSLDNAQLILDLSESMLEGSQYVFDSLKNSLKIKESDIIATAAKQRMLSQRIAKYYISYQSGIKDRNSVEMMRETVKQFGDNLNTLIKNSTNTKEINHKLAEINRLWKIVHKFYINIEKGGLPLIVFNTTDNITKKMDEITKLYLANSKR